MQNSSKRNAVKNIHSSQLLHVCLLGPTPARDIYIPIGWWSFTAAKLLAPFLRVEWFSTLICSFTALELSLKRFIAPIALSRKYNRK